MSLSTSIKYNLLHMHVIASSPSSCRFTNLAQAAAYLAKPERRLDLPIKSPSDRNSISVQVTSNDEDSTEETKKKPYPLHGLSINLRLNYDTSLEKELREQGQDVWEFLEKIAEKAQKCFLYTNSRPYLRLNIRKGDSFTLPSYSHGELGPRNLDSYAERPKPDDIDADIYIAKQPYYVTEFAFLYQNKICRDKKKSVALVLHSFYDSDDLTGEALAVSVATLLGLCKNRFQWNMKQLLQRYEEGRLPCLTEECRDNDFCSSKISCSDEVTGLLCPKKCNKCLILYPPNGLQMRLRWHYNQAFEDMWAPKKATTAIENTIAYTEYYFSDANNKPYIRFEVVNGTKFTDPSPGGLKLYQIDTLAATIGDTSGCDADIFFGTGYGNVLEQYYGRAKFDEVCKSRRLSVGIVLQGGFSYESGTADTLSKVVGTLLGVWSDDKVSWTMKEIKDAYESGKYQCLQPYVCHDQFPCSNRDASMCSDGYTNYLCPKLCGIC